MIDSNSTVGTTSPAVDAGADSGSGRTQPLAPAPNTGRAVPEWKGKTNETAIPPRVKLRIWDRCGGRCHISGKKIMPGDKFEFDHIVALVNGGEHSEFNIAPALSIYHKAKTKQDVGQKSYDRKVRMRHLGIKKRKGRPMPGSKDSKFKKKMNGEVEIRK